MQAEYGSLAEWREIRQQLLDRARRRGHPHRIGDRRAPPTLTLRYPGGADALAKPFTASGSRCESGSGGIWILRSANLRDVRAAAA